MQTSVIRIGTRGSALALAQAVEARDRLMAAHGLPEDAFAIEVISTSGDRIQDRPLSEAGGKGLFTKEIEEALLAGRIDLAVHSSKDMPTRLPDGLEISAFLPREDARDAFIGRTAKRIVDLPQGATVGSASLRRQALLLQDAAGPQGRAVPRQCADPAAESSPTGEVDGTLLANAGLKRLSLADVVTDLMPLDEFPPAPGPGRDLRRDAHRRRSGSARSSRRCMTPVTAAALRLRARLPGRARRLLPHADRRLCAYRRRPAVFLRHDPAARRARDAFDRARGRGEGCRCDRRGRRRSGARQGRAALLRRLVVNGPARPGHAAASPAPAGRRRGLLRLASSRSCCRSPRSCRSSRHLPDGDVRCGGRLQRQCGAPARRPRCVVAAVEQAGLRRRRRDGGGGAGGRICGRAVERRQRRRPGARYRGRRAGRRRGSPICAGACGWTRWRRSLPRWASMSSASKLTTRAERLPAPDELARARCRGRSPRRWSIRRRARSALAGLVSPRAGTIFRDTAFICISPRVAEGARRCRVRERACGRNAG